MSTVPAVNDDHVKVLLAQHWEGYELERLIKPSQNYTYAGTDRSGNKIIIRAVPPVKATGDSQLQRLKPEVAILNYIRQADPELRTTSYIKKTTAAADSDADPAAYIAVGAKDEPEANMCLLVSAYAPGRAPDYMEFEWMANKDHVYQVGKWLGRYHNVMRSIPNDIRESCRDWQELHDNVMAGVHVDPKDWELAKDPDYFGVTHGDINPSNYFVIEDEDAPEVTAEATGKSYKRVKDIFAFDWDQVQLAWYMYDVAQWLHGALMTQVAGVPVPGTPDSGIHNIEEFIDWTVEGYESETVEKGGQRRVDREHLARMIDLRQQFYWRFAERELANPSLPEGMHNFCKYIQSYADKVRSLKEHRAEHEERAAGKPKKEAHDDEDE